MTTEALMDVEAALEQDMIVTGSKAYWDSVTGAQQGGRESETRYGSRLVAYLITPMSEAIAAFIADAESGRPGPRHSAVRYLKQVDPEVVAFLSGRFALNHITRECSLQTLAMSIGGAIEDEVRMGVFEKEAAGMFAVVSRDLKTRTSSREWRRKVLVHTMNKIDIEWESWPAADRLHLGTKCVELLIAATGLIKVSTYKSGAKSTKVIVEATASALEFIETLNGQSELLYPARMPMVVPPAPWEGPRGGGYYFMPRPLPFVKTRNKNYLEELSNRVDEMAAVYAAVNHMQETAWAVNHKVLDVLKAVWHSGVPFKGLPLREPELLPAKPFDISTDADARKAWKQAASRVYASNSRQLSKRVQIEKVITVAEKYRGYDAIYFPHQLDFRGRAYAVPQFLNPQGADYSKALLTFAEGKPITDDRAAGWLMIHGANTFGFDKASLEERIGWVQENHDAILAVATDPLADHWWRTASTPWQFLAFCFDYAGLQAEGFGYVSCLPVALDGTCNGLQHYSAMLRDPVGGRAVNLVPGEEPQDIYQQVANVVIEKLTRCVDDYQPGQDADDPDRLLANQWLAFGVNRKVTKRPVMVLPYGGTIHSCRAYIYEYIVETAREGNPVPWDGDQQWAAASFLSKLVWSSIGEVVVAARDAMGWLQKAAALATKDGLPVTWITPDGLPVMQAYPEINSRRIKTKMGDQSIKLSLAEEGEALDRARQRNGISPNFVHSMDAAAMRAYTVLAVDNGVTSFSLVHDSFGALAADTDVSAACLRHAFVDMYEEHDVLHELRASLEAMLSPAQVKDMPAVPPMGTLDISRVRESTYFFA